jgi:DNA-binding beta-propeller fold protein YncE
MLSRRVFVMLASFLVLAAAAAGRARADELYFADVLNFFDPDGNSIRAVSTDGTGLRTLVRTGGGVRGIALDTHGNKIYWTDADNGGVFRSNQNGQGIKLVTTAQFPSALRLSVALDRLYFGDQSAEELRRVRSNGKDNVLVAGTPFYRGLAIDEAGGRVYWTTSDTASSGRILRANLDGSGVEVVVSSPEPAFKPGSIALDTAGGKVYWTDSVLGKVRRANLDGTGMEDLFDSGGLGGPKGITLDLRAGKVYWGQDIESEGFLFGEIRRMGLDGSNPETVATGLGSVNDLVLVTGRRDSGRESGEDPVADPDGTADPAPEKAP